MIEEKLLSICMMGKDDDYMPDFKYRITTVLNHFAQNLKNVSRSNEVELVIADWGSTPPMSQSLRLSPEAAEICRFIYVAPDIIKITQDGKGYFHTNRAINVYLQRAKGRFIMSVGADQLMLLPALDSMLRLLRGEIQLPVDVDNTFFVLPRQQVPWQFVHRQPSIEEWDRYLFLNEYNFDHEDRRLLHSFGGTAGFLSHKKIWHDLRGCDEKLHGWGWSDIDLGYRATQKYPFLYLSCINATMYHMGHEPVGRRESALQIQNQNPQIHNPSLRVNDSSWGLSGYSLEEMKATYQSSVSIKTTDRNVYSIDKSINQIETDLQDPILAKNVKKIVSLFKQSGWDFDSIDLYPMIFLHWYSRNFYPRNYIEYGFGRGYSSAVVAEPCPSVNIFGVDFWKGIIPVKRPYLIPYFLDSFKFQGYLRFINGDMTTAFQRIQETSLTPIIFDLAFVRTHNLEEKAFDVISSIISSLSSDGALVFTCPNSDQYYNILERLKNLFPEKRFLRSNKNKTGVVLSGSPNVESFSRTQLDHAIVSKLQKAKEFSCEVKSNSAIKLLEKTELCKENNGYTHQKVTDAFSIIELDGIKPLFALIEKYEYQNVITISFFLSPREAYRPTLFSTNEVFCSPDCQTTSSNGHKKTIQTPAGIFDIRQIIDQLPPNQQPELIAIKTDATGRNFPANLKQYNCPKLLILGDTHHLNRPIQTLLTYAAQENFDFIISDHDRQHLHFFREAGFRNVYWIPCLNIYPHEQPVVENKMYDVTFVGQVGRWHPNRKTVLNYLKSNGIAVNIMQAPHEQATEIYAKSLINLNISLNGDMNLRVFEILSSGGFLLTDRLSKESGLEMIFKDGEHLVCYDSPEDLLEKIHYYLNHPQEANAIARNGYEEYKRRHAPEIKTTELMDYIFKGRLNPLYDITQDKRSIYVTSPSKESLFARIAFYEFIQNLHKLNTALTLLFAPSVPPQILCDLSDLPRLRLYIRDNGSEVPHESIALFHNTGIDEQVRTITGEEIKNAVGIWDAVVMNASDLAIDTLEDFLISVNFSLLIIPDGLASIESEKRQGLTDFLKKTGFEAINDNPLVYQWKNKTVCGEYFFSKNQVIGSLRCFERALIDNPADEDALNNLGVISHNFKRYQEAENFFNRAININSRNKNTLDNLIQNYIATERFEDAIQILKERISMEPEQPELYSLLGLCHERLNHANEAHDAYQKAKELGSATSLVPVTESVIASKPAETTKKETIIVDGVFFQMYRTGIARVWKSLLAQWAKHSFGQKLLILDRNGTSPRLEGLRYRQISAYDYNSTDADRAMLQKVCEEENASIFISTYYTTPLTTPSVFMGYDMIPEIAGWDTNIPMWREKHYGIRHAAHYIVISQNTANDLRRFFPDIAPSQITVAHTGVDFSLPPKDAVKAFKNQFGIKKPYWLLVGGRGGYKNGILFFRAFERLGNLRKNFAIVCTGPTGVLEAEYAACVGNADVFTLDLSDENLQAAYAAAIALVYPSLYEGFGMPIIEAMACGCPVITSPSGSIPEVAGDAALMVNPGNVDDMLNAMKKVQKPKLRHALIDRGIRRSQLYSWDKMADEVKNVLLRVATEK